MKKSKYNQFVKYNENMIAYNILQKSVSILPNGIVEQIINVLIYYQKMY